MPMFPPRSSRRDFLRTGATIAAAAACYAWGIEPHWVEIVRRDLPIAGLPPALSGKLIVQISDLHVGAVVDAEYLVRTMQLVSSLRPDLTVITGDFMQGNGTEQIDSTARILEHLMPAPLGTFGVLGNHDYGAGWSQRGAGDGLAARLESSGIRILRNEYADVMGLRIVGIDDLWGPRFDPDSVIPRIDWEGPVVTLCHNPDAVDLPSLADVRGWVLSGHTHGGQCKPPFLPAPLLPVRNRRYSSGHIPIGDGRNLYINRGIGYLHRIRFNARPEITAFRLRAVGAPELEIESPS